VQFAQRVDQIPVKFGSALKAEHSFFAAYAPHYEIVEGNRDLQNFGSHR